MPRKIIVLDPITAETARRMRALLPAGLELDYARSRDPAHLREIVADAEFLVSGQIAVDAALLAAAGRAGCCTNGAWASTISIWRRPGRAASPWPAPPAAMPCRWPSSPWA
ncbi:hypothetical protein [Teichococcus aestuarii]|uniref:hypothetical protein n=1 Tax=Teichococcus aestuarii TaxID=568898 RepID=UPI0036177128